MTVNTEQKRSLAVSDLIDVLDERLPRAFVLAEYLSNYRSGEDGETDFGDTSEPAGFMLQNELLAMKTAVEGRYKTAAEISSRGNVVDLRTK